MTQHDSRSEIEVAAATWAVRIDATTFDVQMQAALDAWLAGDPRRAGALLRAQAALSLMDRSRALPKSRRPHKRDHLVTRRAAMAASLVAGLVLGGGGWMAYTENRKRYQTGLGEIRRVPLADGSLAAINTETSLDVMVTARARQVKLDRGEAWFEVAHDTQRPFVVEAGQVRVRAVGTAFAVRALQDGADVAVTEGVVEAWTAGDEAHKVRLTAGNRAFVCATQPAQPVAAPVEIDRQLAWRQGQIALDGDTLAAAAEEFNRYNTRKLVIDDPELGSEGLVGFFNTNEPESFARAAAASLDARMTIQGDSIHLSR
jgi:transmembrane sensor